MATRKSQYLVTSLKTGLVTSLKSGLKEVVDEHSHKGDTFLIIDRATRVLNVFFELGKQKVGLTLDEQNDVTPLVKRTIAPIELCVFRTRCNFTGVESSLLIKRSAIEFLVEDYQQLVAIDQLQKLRECAKVLDDVIERWAHRDKELDSSDEEEAKTQIRRIDLTGVPKSHSWWKFYES